MCGASLSKWVFDVITKNLHHRNLTVIYLMQNVYIIVKVRELYYLTFTTVLCFATGATSLVRTTMAY